MAGVGGYVSPVDCGMQCPLPRPGPSGYPRLRVWARTNAGSLHAIERGDGEKAELPRFTRRYHVTCVENKAKMRRVRRWRAGVAHGLGRADFEAADVHLCITRGAYKIMVCIKLDDVGGSMLSVSLDFGSVQRSAWRGREVGECRRWGWYEEAGRAKQWESSHVTLFPPTSPRIRREQGRHRRWLAAQTFTQPVIRQPATHASCASPKPARGQQVAIEAKGLCERQASGQQQANRSGCRQQLAASKQYKH